MESRVCTVCNQPFTIEDDDLKFYKKIEVPPPTFCPEDRRLRRLLYRNDRKLYRRTCDLCQKSIIAVYEQKAPFPIYCNECWWSDNWNSDRYARDFDFNRPFFEQWQELNSIVPHIALWQIQNDNSEFTHDASHNKDCYMLFGADYNRNAYYSYSIIYSKDSCDCIQTFKCERMYEATDCMECQFNYFSQIMRNCSECHFCFDMINCHNCFGCAGLRNKSYYFYNKQLTPAEYKAHMAEIAWTPAGIWEHIQKAYETHLTVPRKFVIQKNCEECVGSYLANCKNVKYSFDCEDCRDVSHTLLAHTSKDIHDCEIVFYNGEVCYESQTLIKNCFRCLFSYFLRDAKEVAYCNECYSSQKLFGCVGVRQKKHCILNKQYKPEEYEAMVGRIIEHMKAAGEWGEFFPARMSPFAYNESSAYDNVLPSFTEKGATERGYRWKKIDPKEHQPQTCEVPAHIKDVPDAITNEILACSRCGKNYKIVPQELIFYRRNNIPIPISCFDCRHRARLLRRGPRRLYDRNCARCGTDIKTIYMPEKKDIVYCEKCYLETVY